jgi:hypothetical protein
MPRTCECEHPQSQHKLSKGGCRALDCYCAKFVSAFKPEPDPEPQPVDEAARAEQTTADIEATGHLPVIEFQPALSPEAVAEITAGFAKAVATTKSLGERMARVAQVPDEPATEATSAALRRVEQERDDLAAKLRTSELVRAGLATDARSISARMETVKAELQDANNCLGRIAEVAGVEDAGTGAIDLVGGITLLRAELTSARTELASVKDAATRKVTALLEAQPAPAEPPLWQYTVWFCQPATGCGQRYSQAQPEHECGPLTAAVVTITRQPEGQQ